VRNDAIDRDSTTAAFRKHVPTTYPAIIAEQHLPGAFFIGRRRAAQAFVLYVFADIAFRSTGDIPALCA